MATLFQSFPLRIPLAVVLNQLIPGGVVPLPINPDPTLVNDEDPMQEHNEKNITPPAQTTPVDPAADLQRYLLFAKLPPMTRGLGAPPLPIPGHRIHKNYLQIEPSAHRARFEKILPPNKGVSYEQAVSRFCSKLPSVVRPLPDGAAPTGYEFTMPAGEQFSVPRPALVAPNNIHELSYSLLALPFQTMTRIMHLSFPDTRGWDVTFVPYATQYNPNPLDPPITELDLMQYNHRNRNMADPDGNLWSTYIWRKRPQELDIETYYRIDPTTLTRQELLGEAKCVFVVQPPWIVGSADLKFFVKTTELRPYNTWEQNDTDAADESAQIGQPAEGTEEAREEEISKPPFKSGERIWAKLWDTCVRHGCNYWVLTTYEGWVFGAFTEGFSAGQILCHLSFDSTCPSVLQCLVYHVACAMGLADNILPDYSLTPISSLLDPNAMFEVENPAAVDHELFDVLEVDGIVYKKAKVLVVPPTLPREEPLDYPDSGSEWDGMDEEPDFSSGISQYTPDDALSAYGSEANCERPFNPICLQPCYVDPSVESVHGFPINQNQNQLQPHWIVPIQISRLNGSETNRVLEWNERVMKEKRSFFPPPFLPPRIPSPTPSDEGKENAELFRMALLPSHDPVIHQAKGGQFFGEIVYGLPARLGNILEEDDRMDV